MPLTADQLALVNKSKLIGSKAVDEAQSAGSTDLTAEQKAEIAALVAASRPDPARIAAPGYKLIQEARAAGTTDLTDAEKASVAYMLACSPDWITAYKNAPPTPPPPDVLPLPANTSLPTLSMLTTSFSGTVGTWTNAASYAWELKDADTNAVVATGVGGSVSGSGTFSGAYYLVVTATNTTGSTTANSANATAIDNSNELAHFFAMQSHPNYYHSVGFHSAAELLANDADNSNHSYSVVENACRVKFPKGGQGLTGGQWIQSLFPANISLPTDTTKLSIQWEFKFDHTGISGGKSWNFLKSTSVSPDNRGLEINTSNSFPWSVLTLPVNPTPNPPVGPVTFRVYKGSPGYPGEEMYGVQDIVGSGTLTNPDNQAGGDTAYFRRSPLNKRSPKNMPQFGGLPNGEKCYFTKTGIWIRATFTVDMSESPKARIRGVFSDQENDPLVVFADINDPSLGFPVDNWWVPYIIRGMWVEFNNSSSYTPQDQYLYYRNLIVFKGAEVPQGGRPGTTITVPVLPATACMQVHKHQDFTSVASTSLAFTAFNAKIRDATSKIVAIFTLDNAAGRTVTFSDNGGNAWVVDEVTDPLQPNRCWIAHSTTCNNLPDTVTVTLDQANPSKGFLSIWEVENGVVVGSSQAVKAAVTDHTSPGVAVTKQALLFAGFCGSSLTSTKSRPEISIDVSPQNWYLLWPHTTNDATWTNPAPNHVHGFRCVFGAGSYQFPLQSTEPENGSTAIMAMEAP